VPLVNSVGESFGVNLVPEQLDTLVDSVFFIVFAGMEVWVWLRMVKNKV